MTTKPLPQSSLDNHQIRQDFPILNTQMNGKPLVYLDNAASTQKPSAVIDAIQNYYTTYNANIHRGIYRLSEQATSMYEKTRQKVQHFIHAQSAKEIVFTRGTTESINLVAHSYGEKFLQKNDEILITAMEHHSNIVPWQILAEKKELILKVIPMNDQGEILIDEFKKLINEKTKLLSITHVSNALGTINPIQNMIDLAHQNNTLVFIDAAQSISHLELDVQSLDCDFMAFSSHKLYGPTGVGVLYTKEMILEKMTPYQSGGDMIQAVTFDKTIYNKIPYRFEAGTPNIAGTIGLYYAIEYIEKIGLDRIQSYETELLHYATEKISAFNQIKIIGNAQHKSSILSFVFDDIHPHDIGTFLDQDGIAIRAGHHCAMPTMDFFQVPATVRISLSFYNNYEEIDKCIQSLYKMCEVFRS